MDGEEEEVWSTANGREKFKKKEEGRIEEGTGRKRYGR